MHRISLLLLPYLLMSSSLAAADTAQPNFIVFLTDDQGWGDLGCYGHPKLKTPNLDKFANEGLRLTQCYSACAVCSPSRSAILTGRTPYRNGVWRWIPAGSQVHLRTSEITMATLLKEHGYDTCHAGKWHLNGHFNSDQHPQPSDHGYDHWLATQNNAAPNHLNPVNYVRNGTATGRIEGPSAVIAVEEVITWLQDRKDPDVPFFITVWTHEPHLPIESAKEFMAPYADLEDEGLRQHHGNITQLDHAFGLLMKAVDEMGYRDNTLVIYTSDNGPEGNGTSGRTRGSTGGLRGRKRHSHEGGIRVPGLVRWPGHIGPGSVSSEPVIGSDIFSTVLDAAGIPLPDDRPIDGASMLPVFKGHSAKRTEPLYWRNHLAPPQYRVALRIGDWKIIGSDKLEQFELYNMERDPQETRDLSADYPDKFKQLKAALIEQDREVLEEGPDWWKNEQKKRVPSLMLKPGKDATGDFDVVLGTTVSKEDGDYVLRSQGEGMALIKLAEPLEKATRITAHYQSLATSSKTRNGMIVLGSKPTNNATIKIGTAIGLNQHSIFDGGWANLGRLTKVPAPGDQLQQWNITIVIRPGDRNLDVVINDRKMTVRLPQAALPIRYIGFYNKQTVTSFGPLATETINDN
jgi:arylsulfatase A